MVGYNGNFESYVVDGEIYDTYYIKFNEYDRSAYQWGDYIQQDSQVIIAAVSGSTESTAINTILTAALGTIVDGAGTCITTTSTTTQGFTTTTTSSTLIP
jgi:hypothetical protein